MRRRQMYAEATAAAPVMTIAEPIPMHVMSVSAPQSILEQVGLPPIDENACPRCGRALKARGRHFHINRCKGLGDGW